MDWGEYKTLCDRPDYWSAWVTNQCIELLDSSGLAGAQDVSEALRQDLCKASLLRPDDHKGSSDTWMYQVSLSPGQCRVLLQAIHQAEQRGHRTLQTQIRGLGGFAEHCHQLLKLRQCSFVTDQRIHG